MHLYVWWGHQDSPKGFVQAHSRNAEIHWMMWHKWKRKSGKSRWNSTWDRKICLPATSSLPMCSSLDSAVMLYESSWSRGLIMRQSRQQQIRSDSSRTSRPLCSNSKLNVMHPSLFMQLSDTTTHSSRTSIQHASSTTIHSRTMQMSSSTLGACLAGSRD